MVDNYIEAPDYVIEMLRKEYSLENGDLDLKKLNPETKITAYETHWSENRVSFDTYGGAPASVFAVLCERYPHEQMKYYFYNHDIFGETMLLLNKDGDAVLDPVYEAMLEEQENALRELDDEEAQERAGSSEDFEEEIGAPLPEPEEQFQMIYQEFMEKWLEENDDGLPF